MADITAVNPSECKLPTNPAFKSMRDLKRASNSLRKDKQNAVANDIINSYREFRICCINTSLELLKRLNLPRSALVSARLKRKTSIYRKLVRDVRYHAGNIDDVIGFRVIFKSFSELRSCIEKIEDIENQNVDIKNYIDNEHYLARGYRGVHIILKFKQPFNKEKCFTSRFEVQLRTYYQHKWACWCESMGEQAKEGFKGREKEPEIQEKLKRLKEASDAIKQWEEKHERHVQSDDNLQFPEYSDLSGNFAIIRPSAGDNPIENFTTVDDAFQQLMYHESKGTKCLLLLGLAKDEITAHFKETHSNFLFGFHPEPERWLPH